MGKNKNFDWVEIQKKIDTGATIKVICKLFNISSWSVCQANKKGLIKTNSIQDSWNHRKKQQCSLEELEKFHSGDYKRCYKCNELKLLNNFSSRNSCKDCKKVENQEYYYTDPTYKEKAVLGLKQRRDICRLALCKYLEGKSCSHCPENDPLVLEFDHLRDKKGNISNLVNQGNWNIVLQEIEKCQLLCANCHNRKTAKEKNHLKYRYFTNKKEGTL